MVRARGASFALAAIALALAAGTVATTPAAAGGATTERVWGDGTEWLAAMGSAATVRDRWQPFYVIAPIDASRPQSLGRWGFGPHDNVMGVPPHRQGAYIGPCKVLLVVPGGNGIPGVNIDVVPDPYLGVPIVRAADLDGDGILEPLTSAAAVEAAVAAGLVAAFEPQPGGASIAFACPVRPLHG